MAESLPPPNIVGYTYLNLLGGGGYADVFLYQQANPSRKVAIKVLRDSDLSAVTITSFTAEANAMAALEHPHIVRIYSVGVAGDGRPYIVMGYFANGSLATRVKTQRFTTPEVLRIGIQLASAVETAHRHRLLHRDIKPANVLLGQYDDLGLTDFGIAAEMAAADNDSGLSIPWTAPEVIYQTAPASPQSDVYSLGATLWHLLAGKSPFSIPGSTDLLALITRIRDTEPPPIGRVDVPQSLERLLRHAMAKDPRLRPTSALAFAQGLQAIEQELRLGRTPIALAQAVTHNTPVPQADGTRLKPLAKVDSAQAVVGLPSGSAPNWLDGRSSNPKSAGSESPAGSGAVDLSGGVASAEAANSSTPWSADGYDRPKSKKALAIGLVVAVIVVALGLAVFFGSGGSAKTRPIIEAPAPPPALVDESLPGVVSVSAKRVKDQVTFTWEYAGKQSDDTYRWRVEGGETATATTNSVTVTAPEKVCLSVQVFRANGRSSGEWSTPVCG